MSITAKTLSGEVVTIDTTSPDDFCKQFRKTLDSDIRPYADVKLESDGDANYVLVDLLPIPKEFHDLLDIGAIRRALSLNPSPKASAFFSDNKKLKKDSYRSWVTLVRTHPDAFTILREGRCPLRWRAESTLWPHLLSNPHIQPEWVEYILSHDITIDASQDGWENEYILRIGQSDWRRLNRVPALLPFFETHPRCIIWREMSSNPGAYHLLLKNLDKVSPRGLCANPCKEAIELLSQFDGRKLDMKALSKNPAAIDLLRERLSSNKKISMNEFAKNPAAVEDMITFLSNPKLSPSYYYFLVKQMIYNPNAGPFILDHVENDVFYLDDLVEIAKQPYLFR